MRNQILVAYKSVTGLTQRYANWIAEELEGTALALKEVSPRVMSAYTTVIFGGRFHAGRVDGLKKAKKIFAKSTAQKLIVFATGATPNTAADIIAAAWENNLAPDGLKRIPHFYMQSGLCCEKMPFGDKLMMNVFAAMVKRKKEKSEYETAMEQALGSSYDCSAKKYVEPLVSYVAQQTRKE